MAKIGFIGMGNMGTAILEGLLKERSPEDMLFTAAHQEKMEAVTARTACPTRRPTASARRVGISDPGCKAAVF